MCVWAPTESLGSPTKRIRNLADIIGSECCYPAVPVLLEVRKHSSHSLCCEFSDVGWQRLGRHRPSCYIRCRKFVVLSYVTLGNVREGIQAITKLPYRFFTEEQLNVSASQLSGPQPSGQAQTAFVGVHGDKGSSVR